MTRSSWGAAGTAAVVLAATLLACPKTTSGAPAAASMDRQVARVQLHRSGNRGQAYLPRSRADGRKEPGSFRLRPIRVIRPDGDGRDNVRSNLYPIDVDGDRRFELLQFNGYRFMRVYRQDGRKLWEVRNPRGRVHRSHVHRDTLAVVDVDGDRRQEIVHCWVEPGTRAKSLVVRRGDNGRVVRRVRLSGQGAGSECQIAAFKVPGRSMPILLVAHEGGRCARPSLDLFARTVAFDVGLRRLWERTTCDAGHYAWPLDANGDGAAEGIFVGKYLLSPSGRLRCTLAGWGRDHVDSMVVADLVPSRRGHEVAAVGLSGTRIHSASSCARITTVGGVRNAQHVSAARFSRTAAAPTLMIRGRARSSTAPNRVYRVDGTGRVLGSFLDRSLRHLTPTINANLDGAAAAEDMVTWFGQVIGPDGQVRLGTSWYWNLQKLTRAERRLSVYDQWTNAPVVIDLDRDGRDEIITWGRRVIAIGGR